MLPYEIKVDDTRPDDHPSLSVLPRLAPHEFERLQEFYKFEISTVYGYERAAPGQLFWGISEIELKAGPAIIQPQVRDALDNLILTPPGILLFLSWPGADSFGAEVDPPYSQFGIASFTEANGSVGWGYGGESHIGEDGGPYTVWASSDPTTADYERRVGSDAITKLGWWDDHITPNPIFRVMRKEGIVEPSAQYKLALLDGDTVIGRIDFSQTTSGDMSLGLEVNGEIVGRVNWEDV